MTYEILIIANSSADEKAQKDLTKEISDLVEKENGKVLSSQTLGVKKLATPMKKQETGAYLSVICKLDSGKVSQVTKSLRGNDLIINSFVFSTEAPKIEQTQQTQEIKPAAETVKEAEPKKAETKKKTAVKKAAISAKEESKKTVAKKAAKPKKAVKSDITSEIESEDDRLKKLDDQLDEILKD